jgi:hypothetical protein
MYLKRSSPYFLPLTLDEYLYKIAKDNGKEIRGLETIEEQISALNESYKPKHIYYYFKNIEKYDSLNEELRHAYMAEDNEAMLRFIADSSLTGFNMDILMDRRNDILTSRIDSIVQMNSAFIAVGAGHLFGETGIISGLRKLGYAVTPVRNKKKMHQSVKFEINWKDYKSFNDNFSVSFPTTPDIQKNKERNVYSSDFIADGFISMTFNVIEKIDPKFRSMNTQTMSKVFLYAVQSEFSKETDFTVISSQYLKSSEYFAREVLFNMNNEKKLMIHARFILAQDRLYILTVLIRPNTEDLESIRQFMDSFTILN